METITREVYVSLEIAKLLKKAGFDWRVRYMYRNNNPTLDICTESSYRNTPKPNKCPMYWQYAAPTLEVAQRWLREVGNKNGTVILTLNFNENISKHWGVKGIHLNKDRTVMHWFYTCHVKPYGRGIILVDCWDTYEEAQEAGIKKALEILLEKGE